MPRKKNYKGAAVDAERKYDNLVAALTPSCKTKCAYMSEFSFKQPTVDENGEECEQKIVVPWETIKEVMAKILKTGQSEIL